MPSDVTQLLRAASNGEAEALDEVFPLVYDELHQLARIVRRGRAGETLNTTALVHEAYLKLVPASDAGWNGRMHFMRVAARAMRQVLVDAAKHRMAEKRGGGEAAETFDEDVYARPVTDEALVALDEALGLLEEIEPRQARVVECRFFAGLTIEETATALDISTPTVKRDWRIARAWLTRHMQSGE